MSSVFVAVPICTTKRADVYFIVDSSDAVWRPDFARQLAFVRDVIDKFHLGAERTRVGVIALSDRARLAVPLVGRAGRRQLKRAVLAVRHDGGAGQRRSLADAFRFLRERCLPAADARSNVTKMAIVLTSGSWRRDDKALAMEARLAREGGGLQVFVVGIGAQAQTAELAMAASQPTSYYSFPVAKFADLKDIRVLLAAKACRGNKQRSVWYELIVQRCHQIRHAAPRMAVDPCYDIRLPKNSSVVSRFFSIASLHSCIAIASASERDGPCRSPYADASVLSQWWAAPLRAAWRASRRPPTEHRAPHTSSRNPPRRTSSRRNRANRTTPAPASAPSRATRGAGRGWWWGPTPGEAWGWGATTCCENTATTARMTTDDDSWQRLSARGRSAAGRRKVLKADTQQRAGRLVMDPIVNAALSLILTNSFWL